VVGLGEDPAEVAFDPGEKLVEALQGALASHPHIIFRPW
jgi:hypothetical protein